MTTFDVFLGFELEYITVVRKGWR